MASRIRSLAVLASIPIFIWFSPELALSASGRSLHSPSRRGKDTGQNAVIKVDGAAVYEVQNFDSPVIEYLDSGKKVKISRKIYAGIGGLGTFFKIRLRANVFGYIADTDVSLKKREDGDDAAADSGNGDLGDSKASKADGAVGRLDKMSDDEPEDIKNSFYLDHYFGMGYYSFNYAEKAKSSVQNSQTPLYALKMTGPTNSIGGVPIDMTLLLTTTPPSFYKNFSNGASGMMVFGDFMPFLTLTESKRFYTYWGAGLIVKYSSWSIRVNSGPSIPSEEVTIGIDGALGAAVRISRQLALRLEGKYYWEEQRYFGFGGALEFKY